MITISRKKSHITNANIYDKNKIESFVIVIALSLAPHCRQRQIMQTLQSAPFLAMTL